MKTKTSLETVVQKIEGNLGMTVSLAQISRDTGVSLSTLSRFNTGVGTRVDLPVIDKIMNRYSDAGLKIQDFFLRQ